MFFSQTRIFFSILFFVVAFLTTKVVCSQDTDTNLMYPIPKDDSSPAKHKSKLFLKNPSNIKKSFVYDPETGLYEYKQTIGDKLKYRQPYYMSLSEYLDFTEKEERRKYFREKKTAGDFEKEINWLKPSLSIDNEIFKTIFGGNKIEVIPQASANLNLGINSSFIDNPNLNQNQRRNTNLDFDQNIQLNVRAKVGKRVNLDFSQNTLATFNFENILKLNYTGDEDQIIQKVALGNVSLPLTTSLIQGSQTLFGARLDLKFGRLTIKTVASQERGAKKEVNVQGGALVQTFEKKGSDYEADKHYFLSHYFRDNYESALKSLPLVNSRIYITRVEVWVTNINFQTINNRNIIAFMDLGEQEVKNINNPKLVNPVSSEPYPQNSANNLYFNIADATGQSSYPVSDLRNFSSASNVLQGLGYANSIDYDIYENARKLEEKEYTINRKLGYISLNNAINQDKILAVAFQYTLNGKTYQVGEFSTDGIGGKEAIYVKLLKGTTFNTELLTWDLMMKNIYSLSAFDVSEKEFELNIYHLNPESGFEVPFIPEGPIRSTPLLKVVELDNVGFNNQRGQDGVFDFIPDVTINAKYGRIIFPVLEPFGGTIRNKLKNKTLADKYAFDSLYTTTKQLAVQDIARDRFIIKGKYSSSNSGDIPLNAFNIPRGSVVVTAGGIQLVENAQYIVDYNLGRVRITDQSILSSGKPIKVSLGTQSLFNIQTKTFLGARLDYKINNQFNLGSTVLNFSERPLTQKISIGNEPVNNTILGADITYNRELPILTKIVDNIPFYNTKAKSSVSFQGEFAHLIPGNASAISNDGGTAYLDDFEGAQTNIRLDNVKSWEISSTPQGQTDLFPETVAPKLDQLDYNFNRSKLAWYNIDNLFWLNNSLTPTHIANNSDMQSNHYMRQINQKEVFPFRDNPNNLITLLRTFDMGYYPEERGPYNFDDGISTGGINLQGRLNNPSTRWAGIMRRIETTDFESANIEYIQFWMMDPFDSQDGNPNHSGGRLYINIGDISEDILKDNRKSFENGLPEGPINYITGENISAIDTTVWGRVSKTQNVVNAFSNVNGARQYQDLGFDGLNDVDERNFFGNFGSDPAADNFHHYLGPDYNNQQLNILQRYKNFNNPQGNSPVSTGSNVTNSGSQTPNIEDINRNNNLDTRENYYQYAIDIKPSELTASNVGNNHILNVYETTIKAANGLDKKIKWIQFRIPIKNPDKKIGSIKGYKSIRFIRMFLKDFNQPVILRFARIELLRVAWRQYTGNLLSPGDYIGTDQPQTSFTVSAVNIEENSRKQPVNYIIPPGINRVVNPNNTVANTVTRQNEQALLFNVCNLVDGDARAAFKSLNIDVRRYKRLKLFAHLEQTDKTKPLKDNEVGVFVRLGTDFNNYYEYEIPLKVTLEGVYNGSSDSDREKVWPEYNNIDIDLEELVRIKQLRNLDISRSNINVSTYQEYIKYRGRAKITIKGQPNLKNVKNVMIGVRNFKKNSTKYEDDGLEKCFEVWVNELRMTDFDNHGGTALTAKSTIQVADIGTISMSANYSTPGFGSLEKRLNQRQFESILQYDLSASLNLGQFIPKEIGVNLPFFYSVSEKFILPEFNALDPDIKNDDFLSDKRFTNEYRDSVRVKNLKYSKRRSFNFTNIRKLPGKNKNNFFLNLSNFALSYAYTESFYKDVNIDHQTSKTYLGSLTYNFKAKPKKIEPFKKIITSKELKFIKDFNLNLFPEQYTFSTTIDRMYSERQIRNNSPYNIELPEFYQKYFKWNRIYSLAYNITKSLNIRYRANNNAIIQEPYDSINRGRVNPNYVEEYNVWKDTTLNSFYNLGRNLNYHHTISTSYKVPINKLPYLDFVTLNANYSTDYDWKRANIGYDTLGNTIQNKSTFTLNSNMTLDKIYRRIDYFKKLDKRFFERKTRIEKYQKIKELKYRHRIQKKKYPEVYYAQKRGWKKDNIDSTKKIEYRTFKNDSGKKDTLWREKLPPLILDFFGNFLRSVKSANFKYSSSQGSLLPNYKPTSTILGSSGLSFSEPGIGFIFGLQDDKFPIKAYNQKMLTNLSGQNYSFTNNLTSNFSGSIRIQPVKTFNINVRFLRNYSKNLTQQFFKYQGATDTIGTGQLLGNIYFRDPIEQGTFSMSFNTIATAFVENSNNFLIAERNAISRRLGADNPDLPNGYKKGYDQNQQDILVPAFIASYTGKSGNELSLDNFTSYIPLPNWNVSFSGLSQLPYIKDIFQRVTLSHGYVSTLNIGNFITNINQNIYDINGNIYPQFQISSVNISEQFNPLIGVNITFLKSISLGFNYRKTRQASLSTTNIQITEIKNDEWTVSTGYTIKNLKLSFIKGATFKSDLVTRLNLSYRKNQTNIRRLVERESILTGGQSLFTVKLTSAYKFSKTVNAQAYFDYTFTNPFISNSYLVTNTKAGISLRFSISP